MYLNFFKLDKKPFSLAPDPDFLYLSQQHKDALGAIIYGIREREGFVSVIGEVGTGKTTIIRSYLQRSDRNQIIPVFVFNSRISFRELLQTFLHELGVSAEIMQKYQQVNDLVRLAYQVMLNITGKGKRIVLIIDEAQNMPIETLSHLCTLSNFETSKAKLIQIVLVGQPELQQKLDRHELRQLRQRIAYKALIAPLSKEEGFSYFQHRLSLVTQGSKSVFRKSAIRGIVNHSNGVPRIINVLSENALIASFGLQKKPVSRGIVRQVINEYEGRTVAKRLRLRRVLVTLLILLPGVLLASSYFNSIPQNRSTGDEHIKIKTKLDRSPVRNIDPTAALPTEKVKLGSLPQQTVKTNSSKWIISANDLRFKGLSVAGPIQSSFFDGIGRAEFEQSMTGSLPSDSPSLDTSQLPQNPATQVKIVARGDTISGLCLKNYGFYNKQIFFWLKKHNPQIIDMDQIQVGGVVMLPSLETAFLLQASAN